MVWIRKNYISGSERDLLFAFLSSFKAEIWVHSSQSKISAASIREELSPPRAPQIQFKSNRKQSKSLSLEIL